MAIDEALPAGTVAQVGGRAGRREDPEDVVGRAGAGMLVGGWERPAVTGG
jgi:hypothetical protein